LLEVAGLGGSVRGGAARFIVNQVTDQWK